MNDTELLLALNMVEDLGSIRTQALLEHFGKLSNIFKAKENDLARVEKIPKGIAPKIIESLKNIDIKDELELIKRHGVKIITFLDQDYPENLKNIYAPPIVLYVKGKVLKQDDIAIAIVGSRRASFYGTEQGERLSFDLSSRGMTIVSGLARGIDSSAHKGALKAKGRTLAILGSGISNIYPKENKLLFEEISEKGAVISEFPMKTIPSKGNFPKRNRIIAGLSLGVVVVEASERSGALITSDIAMEEGREVFSVPGKIDSITSKGTNKLIKQGAKLAETVYDVLEELNLDAAPLDGKNMSNIYPILDKNETLVYNLLSTEPQHIDELSLVSSIGITDISKILLDLEMKRFVRQLPGKNFVRS